MMKILFNLGLIIRTMKSLQGIVTTVISEKKISKESAKSFLKVIEGLLDSGVIDIPGVDEAAVSQALKDVEASL